jgi:hypothetical protein
MEESSSISGSRSGQGLVTDSFKTDESMRDYDYEATSQ